VARDREVALDQAQLERGDVRLAYVQHPFPAQGRTTDTTHLILAEHATREGSYVAFTRARGSTHVYAGHDQLDLDPSANDDDRIRSMSEAMSRTEPDAPSIQTPLAHESSITARQPDTTAHETGEIHSIGEVSQPRTTDAEQAMKVLGLAPHAAHPDRAVWDHAACAIETYRTRYQITDPAALGPEPPAGSFEQRQDRHQAATHVLEALDRLERPAHHGGTIEERILKTPGLTYGELDHDRAVAWER
jgi:hypothetical protein